MNKGREVKEKEVTGKGGMNRENWELKTISSKYVCQLWL